MLPSSHVRHDVSNTRGTKIQTPRAFSSFLWLALSSTAAEIVLVKVKGMSESSDEVIILASSHQSSESACQQTKLPCYPAVPTARAGVSQQPVGWGKTPRTCFSSRFQGSIRFRFCLLQFHVLRWSPQLGSHWWPWVVSHLTVFMPSTTSAIRHRDASCHSICGADAAGP